MAFFSSRKIKTWWKLISISEINFEQQRKNPVGISWSPNNICQPKETNDCTDHRWMITVRKPKSILSFSVRPLQVNYVNRSHRKPLIPLLKVSPRIRCIIVEAVDLRTRSVLRLSIPLHRRIFLRMVLLRARTIVHLTINVDQLNSLRRPNRQPRLNWCDRCRWAKLVHPRSPPSTIRVLGLNPVPRSIPRLPRSSIWMWTMKKLRNKFAWFKPLLNEWHRDRAVLGLVDRWSSLLRVGVSRRAAAIAFWYRCSLRSVFDSVEPWPNQGIERGRITMLARCLLRSFGRDWSRQAVWRNSTLCLDVSNRYARHVQPDGCSRRWIEENRIEWHVPPRERSKDIQ